MRSTSPPSHSQGTDVEEHEPVTPATSHEDAADLSSYLDQFGPTSSHTDSYAAHDSSTVPSAELAAVESLLQGTDSAALDGFLDNLLGPLPGDSMTSAPRASAAPVSTSHSAAASASDELEGAAAVAQPQPPCVEPAAAVLVGPPFAVSLPVVCAPVAPSTPAVRTHRVIVSVPSRGGKQREISRVITHDAQALPQPTVDKRAREGVAFDSAGSAGSSSAAGAAGSSASLPIAAEPRERCHLCGATKRGFGRGYCSNVACRERSTLVVRYEQRQSGGGKAAKLAAHNNPLPVLTVSACNASSGAAAKQPRPVVVAVAAVPRATAPRDAAPSAAERALPSAPQLAEPLVPPSEAPPSYDSVVLPSAPAAKAADPLDGAAELDLLTETYVLALPLGFTGAHWFYLGRPSWGWLYMCTFGLLGIGWLADIARAPSLVRRSAQRGFDSDGTVELADAYVLCASPLGLVCALHHWQLQRRRWALLHCLTLGFCGIGWLVDLCRLPSLVRVHNEGCARKATTMTTRSEDLERGISMTSLGSDSAMPADPQRV